MILVRIEHIGIIGLLKTDGNRRIGNLNRIESAECSAGTAQNNFDFIFADGGIRGIIDNDFIQSADKFNVLTCGFASGGSQCKGVRTSCCIRNLDLQNAGGTESVAHCGNSSRNN